jgi:phosphoenolpyruvate-protein phosphotransferase (PTS system enzyme I)
MKILKGIAASSGIVIGKAYLLTNEKYRVVKYAVSKKDIPHEIMRFEDALIKTRKQILKIQREIAAEMDRSHAEIFDAHLMVIEDRTLIEEIIGRLKKEQLNVEYIFSHVLKKYTSAFSKIGDSYLKERVADISDVGRRILRNLLGEPRAPLAHIKERAIVISRDISPSETASMHRKHVVGFATEIGGRTSHTAIMAKSLEIPAVVGVERITRVIKEGETLIVDGVKGLVFVNPDAATRKKYLAEKKRYQVVERKLQKLKDLPAVTLDGRRIHLCANIELPEEIDSVLSHGANGIGLYRTEYLYLNRKGMPTEDEQFASYKAVAARMSPRPVVIRTLDLGGDKFLSQLNMPKEMNPFLGWRAIRFCLAMPKVFKAQLRAILRASAFGKVRIMYPLISVAEELQQANRFLEEAKAELKRRHIKFDPHIKVGAMIEIPSAALTCDLLAKEVEFFSIGTNDLIQYVLAADRVNEKVAYLYDPAHPAVIRLIHEIISTGHAERLSVTMCGEMAGDPELTLVLIGLGLDELSVSPVLIPEIKRIIRSINYKDAQEVARVALGLNSSKKITGYAKKELKRLLKGKTKASTSRMK